MARGPRYESSDPLVADEILRELRETRAPADEGDGRRVWSAELGVDNVLRIALALDVLGDERPAAGEHAEPHLLHVLGRYPVRCPEREHRVDEAVRVATAAVGLDRNAHDLELGLPEAFGEPVRI